MEEVDDDQGEIKPGYGTSRSLSFLAFALDSGGRSPKECVVVVMPCSRVGL